MRSDGGYRLVVVVAVVVVVVVLVLVALNGRFPTSSSYLPTTTRWARRFASMGLMSPPGCSLDWASIYCTPKDHWQ